MGNAPPGEARPDDVYSGVSAGNSSAGGETSGDADSTEVLLEVDCGRCTAALQVPGSTTVDGLYAVVLEELDDYMIPGGREGNGNGNTGHSFRIWISDVQLTKKQSQELTVGKILHNKWPVRLVENTHNNGKRNRGTEDPLSSATPTGWTHPREKVTGASDPSPLKRSRILDASNDVGYGGMDCNGNDDLNKDLNDDGNNEADEVEEKQQVWSATSSTYDELHARYDAARETSCQTLAGVRDMLLKSGSRPGDAVEGITFCADARREEWMGEIEAGLADGALPPETVFGVLGSTGVGKSSLLNALLDEAAVLPTSGSRGCTATAVELRYNRDLRGGGARAQQDVQTQPSGSRSEAGTPNTTEVPVYKGRVEFMTLEDWRTELMCLVDECSDDEKKFNKGCLPEAIAAWSKIDQVYGSEKMKEMQGDPTETVFRKLSKNQRVVKLLTPRRGSTDPYNAICVEEGSITVSEAAATVLCDHTTRKEWAKSFRSKINDYVYRKGNGKEAQTWPLIRRVVLEGPWNALSSGAVLVDLPGVRDANVARARVSEKYLQNCDRIWVVAPIKRAVDDGTAKELMGEQFKRRLLMDGQYGNISFICTQTDDCEATEIMRDHKDVARRVPGRWEKMARLKAEIDDCEGRLSNLKRRRGGQEAFLNKAKKVLKETKTELEEAKNTGNKATKVLKETKTELEEAKNTGNDERGGGTGNDNSDGDEDFQLKDDSLVRELEVRIVKQKHVVQKAGTAHLEWMKKIAAQSRKINLLQKELKPICAQVRNEYSTECLQKDFVEGLTEIYRDANEDAPNDQNKNEASAIPIDGVSLPVFCISANDYLKVTGIKSSSDGPANCFSSAIDTQILRLREHVHEVTASRRAEFTKSILNQASDIVDRVRLLANDSKSYNTLQKVRCKDLFTAKMEFFSRKLDSIVSTFVSKAKEKIALTLQPSLASGARNAQAWAMPTVYSWSSRGRRTKEERRRDKNGLHFSTYSATAHRNGVYESPTAGSIDLNAELVEPMEAEITPTWQSIMDGAVLDLISETERKVMELCNETDWALLDGFCSTGIEKERVHRMVSISSANCKNKVRSCFPDMRNTVVRNQRYLNRSLLRKVQEAMITPYSETSSVEGGKGKFDRMKDAMHQCSAPVVNEVFDKGMNELLAAVRSMVDQLGDNIGFLKESISFSLSSVYSILWEDQNNRMPTDPVRLQKIVDYRNACLLVLNQLREQQDEVMKAMGIERPVLDLEITGVETWEEKNAKKMQAAKQTGDFVDL